MSEINIVKPVRFDGVVVITVRKKGARSGTKALTELFKDFRKFGEKENISVSVQRGKKKMNRLS